ncbi:MAG: hypothetical protein DMF24_11125 [Verrucomicrobia bacterium]|nr:MAG: hypothetical protein DMF24_11125 [Verrucomicrobiota bacterium]
MSKITHTGFVLLLLLWSSAGNYAATSANATAAKAQLKQNAPESQPALGSLDQGGTGTLQKMIVENGSVTMDLDLNRLNGISSVAARPATGSSRMLTELHLTAAANSFFTILVFNDLLRGPEPGSIALLSKEQNVTGLPVSLAGAFSQLVIEKLPSDQAFDLAVRDGKTGFTFFNVEAHQYDYDAKAQLLSITGGNLMVSQEFANALGRPSDAGALVGKISVGAMMRPIEVQTVVNGETKSVIMPARNGVLSPNTPTLVPGPDVIVGDLPQVLQGGNDTVNHFVGLGVGTTSCNNGDQPLDWFALSNTDHPFIPQNLYRMSGGTNNNDRFEQIGQSWGKHAFLALEDDQCSFGCNTSGCATGTHLCPGCSDTYGASLNYGQTGIGSRAWVNPFTGVFPSGANNHSGHSHTGTSHRVTVASSDLNPSQNTGATYFAEGQYITPHEYSWCQSHPGQCNMYNNASYRQFTVSGSGDSYSFSPVGSTVRMQPAIMAWTGATISNMLQPDPGNDGAFFAGYKVTGPSNGIYHYEYAIYNENLDRAIQSFEVVFPGFLPILTNVGFHAPPQEPGWANDGTFNNQGYSSQPLRRSHRTRTPMRFALPRSIISGSIPARRQHPALQTSDFLRQAHQFRSQSKLLLGRTQRQRPLLLLRQPQLQLEHLRQRPQLQRLLRPQLLLLQQQLQLLLPRPRQWSRRLRVIPYLQLQHRRLRLRQPLLLQLLHAQRPPQGLARHQDPAPLQCRVWR